MYIVGILEDKVQVIVLPEGETVPPNTIAVHLDFEPYNIFDENVGLNVHLFQMADVISASDIKISLEFHDDLTGDLIYKFIGTLDDSGSTNSIVSVMEASEEFSAVSLTIDHDRLDGLTQNPAFNPINTLGRKMSIVQLPAGVMPPAVDIFELVTQLDNTPNTLYMQFYDDVETFTEMLRIANKLDARLWVELDPTLSSEQALMTAKELSPFNHRVRFLWSPIVARAANSIGLRGKKVPRIAGGYVVAQHILRDANVNSQGIPPLQNAIAGYDYPINFVGMEQRKDVVLNDPMRKKMADAQINIVQRIKYPAGIRFVIGDVLTAYGDNNSLLKSTPASDISMFIDNGLKAIVFRHLLKATETMIQDATKEARRFLDACTSKERKLLVNSEELGGFYTLDIKPREDRPYDAVSVKCGYRPHGTTRAGFLDTVVSK